MARTITLVKGDGSSSADQCSDALLSPKLIPLQGTDIAMLQNLPRDIGLKRENNYILTRFNHPCEGGFDLNPVPL